MKDLYNNIIAEQSIAPVLGQNSAAPTAVEVDLAGCNSAVILIGTGVEGSSLSTSNYWTWKLEHADESTSVPGTSGSFTSVAAADVLGVTPASGIVLTIDDDGETPQITKIGYVGGKRFIKIIPAETGTAPDLLQAVYVIKGNLLDAPPIV
jgi:hypothetical protein